MSVLKCLQDSIRSEKLTDLDKALLIRELLSSMSKDSREMLGTQLSNDLDTLIMELRCSK